MILVYGSYESRFMDPQAELYGLFQCKDAEDVQAVQINAVCKALTSTLFTSNKTFSQWNEVFAGMTIFCYPRSAEK